MGGGMMRRGGMMGEMGMMGHDGAAWAIHFELHLNGEVLGKSSQVGGNQPALRDRELANAAALA